jgi:TonB-dependent starch-binding outer membrane protein SusC
MDLLSHLLLLQWAERRPFSFNTPSVTKTLKSVPRSLIRIVSLTSKIFLAFCLQVSAGRNAQPRIVIHVKNVSLPKLFAEIGKKANYTFFYGVTILREIIPMTVVFKDVIVEGFLKQAPVGRELKYTITGKTIFVKKESRGGCASRFGKG